MISTPYPNGQILVSSAISRDAMQQLFQTLTCGMLGIIPVDPSLVRIEWRKEGQPFGDIDQDICYLRSVTRDDEYTRVRDNKVVQSGSKPNLALTENWSYTRGWETFWSLYGPNSADRACMIKSALFMDYFNDQLSLQNVFLIPDPPEPVTLREEINAQWWERADFHVSMYEQVDESIELGIASSVEIKVYDNNGQQADATFTAS